MLKIEFSEADVKALHYEHYHHPHPRVQRKMEAVYLKSQWLLAQQDLPPEWHHRQHLAEFLRDYQRGGLWKCHLND